MTSPHKPRRILPRTTRDLVAVILAVGTAIAMLILVSAAIIQAVQDPARELSNQYVSLLTGTLGVMVGALAGFLGGRAGDEPPAATVPPSPVVIDAELVDQQGRHAVDTPTTEIPPITEVREHD